MMRRTWLLLAVSLSAGAGHPAPAQPAADGPSKPLPAWLAFSAEALARADSASAFDPEGGGRFYWSRLRAGASLQPSRWFRVLIEGQDARGASLGGSGIPAALHDPFDLLQAWAEVGRAETGWRLRIGRQELALGDERLLGSDRYWDWFGQVFDAVRAEYTGHRLHAAAFSGFRVEPSRRRINPFDTASRIAGASLRLETAGEGELEPFLLWKRGGNTVDLMGRNGHRDVVAPGLRAQRSLPWRLDGNFEMVLERGH
ncbi:MAG: alginate export family protein, partial [Acidobacteriota bacterium]|nr:alginate export family protein [Acidobacteriota bacterium]